jgi:hypothetical protein
MLEDAGGRYFWAEPDPTVTFPVAPLSEHASLAALLVSLPTREISR